MMKNIPQKIYLQIGEDAEDVDSFDDLSDVTWCADNINQNDIEYRLSPQPIASAYKDVDSYQIWDDIIDMMDDYRASRERRNDFIERLKKNYNVSLAADLPIDKAQAEGAYKVKNIKNASEQNERMREWFEGITGITDGLLSEHMKAIEGMLKATQPLPIDKGSDDKNIFELLQEQEYTGPLSMPMPAQEFFPPTKKESVIDKGSDEYELERLVSMVCDQFDAPFDGRIAFCKKAVNDWKKSIAAQKETVIDKGSEGELVNTYWEERCLAAENCIEKSPCDPDITPEQIKAHAHWEKIKAKNPPIQDTDKEAVVNPNKNNDNE